MELWDAYSQNFQKIEGLTLKRGEVIPQGVFHLCVKVIIRHQDGTFLITQRKENIPNGGKLELSFGGAALQGEEPLISAKREMQEEIGLSEVTLKKLGVEVNPTLHALFVIYYGLYQGDKNHLILQQVEISKAKWINLAEVETINQNLFASNLPFKYLEQIKNS
jgi:8-oxo-dGTP pyrophosphatase MutT (NUDIX family)